MSSYIAISYITNNTHLQFSAYHWAEQKDLALLVQLTMMLTFSLPSSYVVSSNDIRMCKNNIFLKRYQIPMYVSVYDIY